MTTNGSRIRASKDARSTWESFTPDVAGASARHHLRSACQFPAAYRQTHLPATTAERVAIESAFQMPTKVPRLRRLQTIIHQARLLGRIDGDIAVHLPKRRKREELESLWPRTFACFDPGPGVFAAWEAWATWNVLAPFLTDRDLVEPELAARAMSVFRNSEKYLKLAISGVAARRAAKRDRSGRAKRDRAANTDPNLPNWFGIVFRSALPSARRLFLDAANVRRPPQLPNKQCRQMVESLGVNLETWDLDIESLVVEYPSTLKAGDKPDKEMQIANWMNALDWREWQLEFCSLYFAICNRSVPPVEFMSGRPVMAVDCARVPSRLKTCCT